jgi:chromosomal replication initiation ATPase DnaA
VSEPWQEICALVAWRHGLTMDDLRGPRTARKYSRARQEAYANLYDTGRYSLPRIGKWLGERDHSTVLMGIRRHRKNILSTAKPGTGGQSQYVHNPLSASPPEAADH